jgi:serine protease
LIVRLADAPAHSELDASLGPEREQAQRRSRAEAQALRWARLLQEEGHAGASLRPVGKDQQLLQWASPLPRERALAIAQRLRARPDVAWVELNQRERRLSLPNDPQFNSTNPGQWWLKAYGGTSGNAINDRLRGVPDFARAWQLPGGNGIGSRPAAVVAVLDTGITCHSDLGNLSGSCIGGSILPGYDFVGGPDNPANAAFDPNGVAFANDGDRRDDDPRDPGDWVSTADKSGNAAAFADCAVEDSSWHGTIIAGIIAAQTNNSLGVAGIHWAGKVLPVRVAGKCGASVADIVDGMRWAAGLAVPGVPLNPNPARIVNVSFGGTAACGSAYQTAIDELRALGVVVVAAAGNEFTAPTRPANCAGAVGVVALNRDGFKSNYSNFGSALAEHGIATVGGDDGDGNASDSGRWGPVLGDSGLVTLFNTGLTTPQTADYARLYGTSFSAPVVAGTLALMLHVNPGLSWTQLTTGLRLSARPHVVSTLMGACSSNNPGRCICNTSSCGAGILDAQQALLYAANPGTYVAPVRSADNIDSAELQDAISRLGSQDRGANAPSPPPVVEPPAAAGGGGASSLAWLAGLALAGLGLAFGRGGRRRGA